MNVPPGPIGGIFFVLCDDITPRVSSFEGMTR